MITFPCAKINLGLNIVGQRPNGYHDLETVFYLFRFAMRSKSNTWEKNSLRKWIVI